MDPHCYEAVIAVDALFDERRGARAAGYLLTDGGRPLFCVRAWGARNSMDAEMYALLAAMRCADTAGWERVLFKSDCKGIVTQVTEPEWEGRERGPARLRAEARDKLAAHSGWWVKWVGRDGNRQAHALVNRGPSLAIAA